MADYRVIYADTATGAVLGELPATNLSYSESLNGAGSLSVDIPLDTSTTPTLALAVGRSEITAADFSPDGRTSILVERSGALVWGGIMWGYQADLASQRATVSAAGFLSYFDRRLITADATYAATEQTAIAWGLINAAQTASSIGVTDGSTATGTTRDRTYEGVYATSVGQALRNLTQLNGGFDMRIRCSWSAGALVRSFETSYPQTGRATSHVLDTESNIAALMVTANGSKVNTLAYADGKSGTARQSTANATLELAIPRLEAIEGHSSVSETATLLAHSARLSQRGSVPVRTLRATVVNGAQPHVGSFETGDVIEVRGGQGWLDLAGDYRVTAYSVSVDSTGTEALTLDLASQEAF